MFVSRQVPPDNRYYYSGPDDFPNAIIGIQNDYSLESRFRYTRRIWVMTRQEKVHSGAVDAETPGHMQTILKKNEEVRNTVVGRQMHFRDSF